MKIIQANPIKVQYQKFTNYLNTTMLFSFYLSIDQLKHVTQYSFLWWIKRKTQALYKLFIFQMHQKTFLSLN